MFRTNSNQDRVSYSDLLIPPPGYSLDIAVGTTYSLDLESLTAVAIALGLKENLDSNLLQNPICMLNAIEKVSRKMIVFCEAGQIKANTNASALMLLLEKIVVPVTLPKRRNRNGYPAFHPKTWLLRYVGPDGDLRYRFVVLSRNLTFDRSWDISISLDSTEELDQTDATEPIISFLNFLRNQIGNDVQDFRKKRSTLKELSESLREVSFALNSQEFGEDFMIMPLGIGADGYNMEDDELFRGNSKFNDLVVFSPFLSASVIEEWNKQTHSLSDTKRILITRRSALSELRANQADQFRVFVLKDDIVEGEDQISEENEDKQRQDIHAKIYLMRRGSFTFLYLGSMNASTAAISGNVEMVMMLKARNRYLNGEKFLEDIFCGKADGPDNPFEEVTVPDKTVTEAEDESKKLEKVIKDLCRCDISANITKNGEKYDVEITVADDIPSTWGYVSIAPLRRDTFIELKQKTTFKELDVLQLTEFYRICVKGSETEITRVIMIPTVGMPEDRESAVVNSVIKDKSGFVEYVAFVLGDSYLMTMLEQQRLGESGIRRSGTSQLPALYEKMLKTAAEDPDRLQEIEYLLTMIKRDDIIPDEFRDLYATFRATLRIK